MLTSELSLSNFNLDLEIILALSVNDYDSEAVICHEFKDSKIKTVAHASRTLTAADKNYSQIEKEALEKLFCIRSPTIIDYFWF